MAVIQQQPILDDLLAAFEEAREGVRGVATAQRRRDAEDVVRMVTNRGEALGGHIRQLVRVVRLAALCSRHVYVEFIEAAAQAGNPRMLGDLIERALDERQVPVTSVVLKDGRVFFNEPAMWPDEGGTQCFDLSLEQIQKLVLLHQVLCRFLHYPRLYNGQAGRAPGAEDEDKGLLWPIVGATPPLADDVARRLQSVLNGHLTRVLESTSHSARQVQVITRFLASRGEGTGRTIQAADIADNQLLFEFWETEALAGEDGFKLYRSAVTKMLRYRRALIYAQAELGPRLSLGAGGEADEVDLDRLAPARLGDFDTASPGIASHPLDGGEWQSPMIVLSPIFKVVKFLNEKECVQLANFLDGCSGDDEAGAADQDDETSATGVDFRRSLDREFARPFGGALMGKDRLDLRLARTLLRVDVFDPCQRAFALRSGPAAEPAVAAALAGAGEESYRERKKTYFAIREQLLKGMLASIHVLGSSGDANALVLMARLCERSVVDYFVQCDVSTERDELDPSADELVAAIEARLRAAFQAPADVAEEAVRQLARRAKQASDQVRRKGFRSEEWQADAEVRAAHAEAAGELVRLLDEIERLLRELERLDKAGGFPHNVPGKSLVDAATGDCGAFAAVFRKIYLE